MELRYILIIIGVSLFLILFLTYVFVTARRRKREALLMESLEQMYDDANLAQMNYDFAAYDEELEKIIAGQQLPDGQISFDDIMDKNDSFVLGKILQNVDSDGVEEITGNYKPD